MLFALIGFFRADAEPERDRIHERLNEYLAQPFRRVRFGGPLWDASGRRTGGLILLEADGFEQARAFLAANPYIAAGLYERTEVHRLDAQVGRIA
jgi:uncharacterized protein YciI